MYTIQKDETKSTAFVIDHFWKIFVTNLTALCQNKLSTYRYLCLHVVRDVQMKMVQWLIIRMQHRLLVYRGPDGIVGHQARRFLIALGVASSFRCFVVYLQQQQQQPFYRVSRYQKKHSPTHTYHHHQPSFIDFLCPLRSTASSPFNLHAWQFFAQPISKSSLVDLWVSNPPLHTPHISSPNHYRLFTTHAHTITTCFAVVPR